MHSFTGGTATQAMPGSFDARQPPYQRRPVTLNVPGYSTQSYRGYQTGISSNEALSQHRNFPAQAQATSVPQTAFYSSSQLYGTGQQMNHAVQNYPSYGPPAMMRTSSFYGAPNTAQAHPQIFPQTNPYYTGQIPKSGGAIPPYAPPPYYSYDAPRTIQAQVPPQTTPQNTAQLSKAGRMVSTLSNCPPHGTPESTQVQSQPSANYCEQAWTVSSGSPSSDFNGASPNWSYKLEPPYYNARVPSGKTMSPAAPETSDKEKATQPQVSVSAQRAPQSIAQLPKAEGMVSTHSVSNCPPNDQTAYTGGFSPQGVPESTQAQGQPFMNYCDRTWIVPTGSPSSDINVASPNWSSQLESPSYNDRMASDIGATVPEILDKESVRSPQSIVSDVGNYAMPPRSSSNMPKPQNAVEPAAQKKVPYVPRSAHHFVFSACFLTRKPETISIDSDDTYVPAASSYEHQTSPQQETFGLKRENAYGNDHTLAMPQQTQMSVSSPETNAQFFWGFPGTNSLTPETYTHSSEVSQADHFYPAQKVHEATGQNAAYQSPSDPAPVVPQTQPSPLLSVSESSQISDKNQHECRTSSSEGPRDVNNSLIAKCDDQTQINQCDAQNSDGSSPTCEALTSSFSDCSSVSSIPANKVTISEVQQEADHPVKEGGTEQKLITAPGRALDSDAVSCERSGAPPDDSGSVPHPPAAKKVGQKRRRPRSPGGDEHRGFRKSSRSTRTGTAPSSVSDSEVPESTEKSLERAVKRKRRRRSSTAGLIHDFANASPYQPQVLDAMDSIEKPSSPILTESACEMEEAATILEQCLDAALKESSDEELARAVADLLDTLRSGSPDPSSPDRSAEQAKSIQNAHLKSSKPVLSVHQSPTHSTLIKETAWDALDTEVKSISATDLIYINSGVNGTEESSVFPQENTVSLAS